MRLTLAATTALLLALAPRAAAEPTRPTAGLAIGRTAFPADDDSFNGTLLTGFVGARLRPWLAVTVRLHHAADSIFDPFDQPLDRHDRYVMALPTVRLGRVAWAELGLGGAYRWRHYANGTDADKVLPAFDLAFGVTPAPASWTVKPELAVGMLSSTGFFAVIGVRH